MSVAIEFAGSPLGTRFILQWNGVAALAIALSTAMTAILAILGSGAEDFVIYPIGAAVLSFPIMSALGQGWVMRGRLKHPVLWGTLTGGGIVAAFASVITVGTVLDKLWQPIIWQLAVWIGRSLGLGAPPSTFVAYVGGGLLFGLALGGTGRRSRSRLGLPPALDRGVGRSRIAGGDLALCLCGGRGSCEWSASSTRRIPAFARPLECRAHRGTRSNHSLPLLHAADWSHHGAAPAPPPARQRRGAGPAVRVVCPKKVACHSTPTHYVG